MKGSYIIIKKKIYNDNDDENNGQNKDNNNNKNTIKRKAKKQKKTKNKQTNIITTNKTLIYNKQNTYMRREREKKITYLLHPNYKKTTLYNTQRKYHVH